MPQPVSFHYRCADQALTQVFTLLQVPDLCHPSAAFLSDDLASWIFRLRYALNEDFREFQDFFNYDHTIPIRLITFDPNNIPF